MHQSFTWFHFLGGLRVKSVLRKKFQSFFNQSYPSFIILFPHTDHKKRSTHHNRFPSATLKLVDSSGSYDYVAVFTIQKKFRAPEYGYQ
jgi:hypothetical protein